MTLIYKGWVSYRTPCEFTPCDLTTYKADFESRFWKRWMILRTNWKIVFSHNSLLTILNGTRIFRKIDFFLGISRNLAKFCESWVFCEKHINYTLFFPNFVGNFLMFLSENAPFWKKISKFWRFSKFARKIQPSSKKEQKYSFQLWKIQFLRAFEQGQVDILFFLLVEKGL